MFVVDRPAAIYSSSMKQSLRWAFEIHLNGIWYEEHTYRPIPMPRNEKKTRRVKLRKRKIEW